MRETTFRPYDGEKRAATVFLCVALALFLALVWFFAWHIVRMRRYELDFVRVEGTVTGVEVSSEKVNTGRGRRTIYRLEISYTFGEQEYTFVDRTGYASSSVYNKIGTATAIYIDPQSPQQAEKVSSSDFVSIICACFFAFFCVVYAIGASLALSIRGSKFIKRFALVWGAEILLGALFLLLFWLGLPHSPFADVFVRIRGAAGVVAVSGMAALAILFDGLIFRKLKKRHE